MAVTELVRPPTDTRTAPSATRYSAAVASTVAVAMAFGVAMLLVAFAGSRHGEGTSVFAIYWLGQLVAVLTILWAGTRRTPTHRFAHTLLAAYAVFNFLPKILISPWRPIYFDEYGHFQQAQSIVATHSLRPPDTYQPILRDFPGLEWSTVLVHYVTRLSVWHSGQVVVGLAHIAALLAVYGIARGFTLDSRGAFVAAMVFSFNPSFQFFDTEFAYESLALPLALVTIYCVVRIQRTQTRRQIVTWCVLALIVSAATTMTHHLSTFFATAVCASIAIFGLPETPRWGSRRDPLRRSRMWASLLVVGLELAIIATWVLVVARSLGGYLGPHIVPAFGQLTSELSGGKTHTTSGGIVVTTTQTRGAFSGNNLSPHYEVVMGFATPFILLAVVTAALLILWRQGRLTRGWFTPVALAVTFFVSLPFSLTLAGSEGAHRSWGFSFLGLALLTGFVSRDLFRLVHSPGDGFGSRGMRVIGALIAVVVLIGETTVGVNVYFRFPGPYQFGTDTRGVTAQTRDVATWLNNHVPVGSHIVTDRFTGEVVTGYTRDYVPMPSQAAAYGIYKSGPKPATALREYLQVNHFSYFVLDTHIEHELPPGAFFAGYKNFGVSISPTGLRRMGRTRFATLVYQLGTYEVFALHPLAHGKNGSTG